MGGFLAGYSDKTFDAYAFDLRQWSQWRRLDSSASSTTLCGQASNRRRGEVRGFRFCSADGCVPLSCLVALARRSLRPVVTYRPRTSVTASR